MILNILFHMDIDSVECMHVVSLCKIINDEW